MGLIRKTTRLHPKKWPVDLRKERSTDYGFLPPGHKLRCQGLDIHTLEQCPRRGYGSPKYCSVCKAAKRVTSFYFEEATPRLKELLEKASDGAPDDRLSLAAEIDMARVMTQESVKLFSAIVEHPDKVNDELKTQVFKSLNRSLNQVATLVQKQAQVIQAKGDILTHDQYAWAMQTVKKLIGEFFPEDKHEEKREELFLLMDGIAAPRKEVAARTLEITIS